MILTGKTIPQLPQLTATTNTSLLPIQLLGTTYHTTILNLLKSSPFGTFYQDLIPSTGDTFSIGSLTNKVKSFFVSSITANDITTSLINTNTVPTKGGTFAMLGDITANTVGGGSNLFISASSGNLTFRSLSSSTPNNNLSITTSSDLILLSSSTTPNLDYIDFNTAATQSTLFGRVYFDGTEQALTYYGQTATPVRVGQQLYSRVINNSGALIPKGSAVKITGATSGLPAITPAIASHLGDNRVAGITILDIDNGATGLIITKGLFSGLTLNDYVVGDSLFLSPFSAGTYTSSTTSFPFASRVNRLGRVVATGITTGQIFVDIANEDNTLSLTSIERNILEGNVISTGTYEYTGLTLGTGKTINIAPLRGWVVQNTYANATLPEVINLYYSGETNVTLTNLTTADNTFLLINSASTLVQQTTFPTPQERRQNIFIGKVVHVDRVNITALLQNVDFDVSPMASLRDLWTPLKLVNQGIITSPNGANLRINTSSGTLWGNGIGWTTNQLNPNSVAISGQSPVTFQYRTRNGAITGPTGTTKPYTGNTISIDPNNYDNNGTMTAVGGGSNESTNQRVFLFPTGLIRIQYGQQTYGNLAAAVSASQTESFTEFSNNRDNGILICIISVKKGVSDLSNTDNAKFNFVSKFGEILGGTAGLSTTTLQQAYDNSAQPEILINSTLDGFSIKNGTGNADSSTKLFEGINTANAVTSFIKADGTISGLTFLGDGSQLIRHYGSFYSTSAMTAANTTTAYIMSANTTGLSNAVILSDGSKIVMQSAGTYDIKYSAQLIKTSGSPSSSTVSIWLRKNGTDIQNTNAEFDITKLTANNGKAVASWNYIDTFTAGQYIEFVWSTTSTDVSIGNIGTQANPTRPTTPSLYVSVRQV